MAMTTVKKSTPKPVLQQLLMWSASRPAWQRDALRRIVSEGRHVPQCAMGSRMRKESFEIKIPNDASMPASVTLLRGSILRPKKGRAHFPERALRSFGQRAPGVAWIRRFDFNGIHHDWPKTHVFLSGSGL